MSKSDRLLGGKSTVPPSHCQLVCWFNAEGAVALQSALAKLPTAGYSGIEAVIAQARSRFVKIVPERSEQVGASTE